jgi:tRNA U55 pseudouridine synthase TruB
VLPLVLEKASRLAQFYTRRDRIYEGVVHFAWSTNAYDRAGEATSEKNEVGVDAAELEGWSDSAASFCRHRRRKSPL